MEEDLNKSNTKNANPPSVPTLGSRIDHIMVNTLFVCLLLGLAGWYGWSFWEKKQEQQRREQLDLDIWIADQYRKHPELAPKPETSEQRSSEARAAIEAERKELMRLEFEIRKAEAEKKAKELGIEPR